MLHHEGWDQLGCGVDTAPFLVELDDIVLGLFQGQLLFVSHLDVMFDAIVVTKKAIRTVVLVGASVRLRWWFRLWLWGWLLPEGEERSYEIIR